MKLNALWKGLIMALVGFLATTISSLETFNAAYVLIATAGFTVVYIVKNAVWPSISVVGIDVQDFLSGLILAAGMALSSYAAMILTDGFSWHALWVSVVGAVVGYFAKTIPSNAKTV